MLIWLKANFLVTLTMKDNLLTNSMEESIISGEIHKDHDLTNSFCEFCDMNVDKDQYDYFRHFLIADYEDDLKNFHVSMVGDTHACGNGVFRAIIQIYHRDDNYQQRESIFLLG